MHSILYPSSNGTFSPSLSSVSELSFTFSCNHEEGIRLVTVSNIKYVPISIFHGLVIDFAVPFFVTFFSVL